MNTQFTYRPAGGNASLDLVVRDPGAKEPVEAGKNGALLVIGPEGPAFDAAPQRSAAEDDLPSQAALPVARGASGGEAGSRSPCLSGSCSLRDFPSSNDASTP